VLRKRELEHIEQNLYLNSAFDCEVVVPNAEEQRHTLVVPFSPNIVLSTSHQSIDLPLHVSENWDRQVLLQSRPVSRVQPHTTSWLPPSHLPRHHLPGSVTVQSDIYWSPNESREGAGLKEHAWGVREMTSGAILRVSMKVQGMIVASETAKKTLLKMERFMN